MSFYVLEAQLEEIQQKNVLAAVSTSAITILAGFIVTSVLAALLINAGVVGFNAMALAFLKAVFMGVLMVLGASVIATTFDSLFLRRVNSFVLGTLFGVFLVLVSL